MATHVKLHQKVLNSSMSICQLRHKVDSFLYWCMGVTQVMEFYQYNLVNFIDRFKRSKIFL